MWVVYVTITVAPGEEVGGRGVRPSRSAGTLQCPPRQLDPWDAVGRNLPFVPFLAYIVPHFQEAAFYDVG